MRDGVDHTNLHDGETSLVEVVDRIGAAGRDGQVTVNEVLKAFSDRSTGVLLTALGFIAALPVIGDIPGMSMLTGALILLALGQQALSGGALRLPGKLGRRAVSQSRMNAALDRTRPWAAKVDGFLKPRLTWLTVGRGPRLALAVTSGVLALTFFPLAFVPFGVNAPATAVLALGLARMTRDGYAAAFGYAMAAVTVVVLWTGYGLIAAALA